MHDGNPLLQNIVLYRYLNCHACCAIKESTVERITRYNVLSRNEIAKQLENTVYAVARDSIMFEQFYHRNISYLPVYKKVTLHIYCKHTFS